MVKLTKNSLVAATPAAAIAPETPAPPSEITTFPQIKWDFDAIRLRCTKITASKQKNGVNRPFYYQIQGTLFTPLLTEKGGSTI